MDNWQRLCDDLGAAIDAGELCLAQALLGELRSEAELYPDEPRREAHTWYMEGVLLDAQSEPGAALFAFRQALARDERIHGPESLECAAALHSIALVQAGLGNYTAAAAAHRRPAIADFSRGTRMGMPDPPRSLRLELAAAWYGIGVLGRYLIQDGRVDGAIAYWYCSLLEPHERALKELHAMPERELAVGDPHRFRLTYNANGFVHVASLSQGHFMFKGFTTASLGALVEVDFVDGNPVDLRAVPG